MLRYRILDRYTPEEDPLLRQACAFHYEALSYRSFVTQFGAGFLHTLYTLILKTETGFLSLAEEKGKLVGFALYLYDASRLMPLVLRYAYLFLPRMLPVLLKNPALIRKTLETLLYGSKKPFISPSEMLVIAVDPEYRSRGIGEQLLKEGDLRLGQRGIRDYVVTVHAEMGRSNRFYEKAGMILTPQSGFLFLGTRWNIYLKKLDPQ